MEICSLLKMTFLNIIFESNNCSLKIGVKSITFISNKKEKYLHLEDELKKAKSGRLTFTNVLPCCYSVAKDMVESHMLCLLMMIYLKSITWKLVTQSSEARAI